MTQAAPPNAAPAATDSPELSKSFEPAELESRWYAEWDKRGYFAAGSHVKTGTEAQPYVIQFPPPNVTGTLHMGHAFNQTIMDGLIRYHRMLGDDTVFIPGTDHAGIATQIVVERQLDAQKVSRHDLGREKFLEKVWEWKEKSGSTITGQVRRLGASADWPREYFTMDERMSRGVVETFVRLHKQGLIYRGKRLVNWDPKLLTAVSDLEVLSEETDGHMWHILYPFVDGPQTIVDKDGQTVTLRGMTIATTRPETMLADGALCVHPEDPRYKHLVGKEVELPLCDRNIPIIADDFVDPEFGTGCVKITGAHDFNDYACAMRHDLPLIVIFTLDAHINENGPKQFQGMERYEARKAVVAQLEAEGYLVKVEPHKMMQPKGDRTGVVLEPMLTDQWFVAMSKPAPEGTLNPGKSITEVALEVVADGRIQFYPDNWTTIYNQWLNNIQDWCISRQLWWGHQIPAWYAEDGQVFVAHDEAEAIQQARAAGVTGELKRDPDVLDTWFSSALWPFGTLGWPEQSETLSRHYPNDLLISGFDILFFWDARMAMQGMEFMGDVPWKKLYLHGLVRAADGQKMSKSKGNVVDPLGLIDKFGADALRFFMAAMESQGRDVKMDEKRVEGYRNFATKLWNAARFLQANGVTASTSREAPHATLPVNRWIIAETVATVQAIDTAMAELRFDAGANAIYHFVWDQYCDWYIELTKGSMDDETKAVAGWAFDQILVMLHPFMPFITEELWQLTGQRAQELIVAEWPVALYEVDTDAQGEIDWLIRLVSAIRTARTELNVPPGAKLRMVVRDAADATRGRLDRQGAALARLGRIESLAFGEDVAGGAAQIVVDEATFILPLEGVIDIAAEKTRLEKALAAAAKERDSLGGRLSNPAFVEKAKPEAVAKAREDHAEKTAEAERLKAALDRLG
ncbi:valine--tRNA ligase [Sphingobium yanoikuyae]|uniref:valine--tRNA ligase n=1 Tax=Sphingobium yanoikuyae TaxID=13690 RepID=UPI002443D2EF|nr:valine--tRNA ligase [Sphingobium yanoikuyae]